ncbi:hypothetical protein [Bradyrhizobium australafricanum]|uniref:hypothetical protein n=1 Tax=Bradyrhizobium australafricanum TaxID=2821406 RepID=UPI001CE3901D|nr:hypothetical protein [Bradyrhizobium australafricanum]MCA6101041.1 hypothetical protein [Bradyrhizobium australafricanum]
MTARKTARHASSSLTERPFRTSLRLTTSGLVAQLMAQWMGKLGFELEIVADYIFSEVKMMVMRCIMHRRFERNRQGASFWKDE